MGGDGEGGVEAGDPRGGGFGLRAADVERGEDRLALEVGGLDRVVVDEGERAHAGRREILQRRGANAAAADEHDMGLAERHLTRAADLWQDDVAGEAVQAFGGEH